MEILDKPIITGIGFYSDSTNIIADTLSFNATVRFSAAVKLVNKEKNVARLVAEVIIDTLTGDDYVRQLLLSENKKVNLIPSQELFPFQEIGYLDTLTLSIVHQLQRGSEKNEGILHYFVLYENEAGALYDVYYWIKYSFNPVQIFQVRRRSTESQECPFNN